jgi:hypothetical protein
MYRRYDFKKIFEAEQMGEPLNPEDMGLEQQLSELTPNDHTGYELDIALSEDEIESLKSTGKFVKTDAHWKKTENLTDVKPIENLVIETVDGDETVEDAGQTVTLHVKLETINRILDTIKDGGLAKESIGETKVTFTKSVAASTPEQVAQEIEEPIENMPNESANKEILSFNQFINEKKGDWVADMFNEITSFGSVKKTPTKTKKVAKKPVHNKRAKK